MKQYFDIYINNNRIGKSATRADAFGYIEEEHGELLPFLEYNPVGVGDVEIWENGLTKIEIRRILSPSAKIDVLKILEKKIKQPQTVEKEREVNVTKVMPCTPRRTRIKNDKNKLEIAEEGKIIEKNGKKYISKKDKKGNYKWNIYQEAKYEKTNTTKRKAPKSPAKDYKEGTVKKGLDGNNWIVKKLNSGAKKWIKK